MLSILQIIVGVQLWPKSIRTGIKVHEDIHGSLRTDAHFVIFPDAL